MFWPLAGIAAVAVAVVVWGEWRESRVVFVAKPLASLAFIAAAIERGALDSTYGRLLFAGLILAALGDVFLLGSTRATFLAGLIAFLLGHVAYVVAFSTLGPDLFWLAGAAAGIAVIASVVFRWLRPHLVPPMTNAVMAYVIVISIMVVAAVGVVSDGATPWILVGASGFFLSDLSIARHQFVAKAIVNRMWGLPLYYGSQFVLAWTAGA